MSPKEINTNRGDLKVFNHAATPRVAIIGAGFRGLSVGGI